MPGLSFPPFPENISTHQLLVIDYELLRENDPRETGRLWQAATELGFWYLKNHGAGQEVEGIFEMGAKTFDLPLEEKMKFEQGDSGNSFGYKALGAIATNEFGDPDNVEFINVSREDALAYPKVVHRTYPSTVHERMEPIITPFVRKSQEIVFTMFSIFEEKLELPAGTLRKLHALEEPSGSEARCIKSPPKYSSADGPIEKDKVAIGAHTDVGSISFLHNKQGGLQVLPPGSPDWQYVRPIPGHAICNIGDALALFSAGILRSSMHRVVPPPGAQSAFTRWSAVFFSRPGSGVQLRALEESPLVKEALDRMDVEDRARYDPKVTQGEWYARRVGYIRLNNRKGPETFRASRGMEHKPHII